MLALLAGSGRSRGQVWIATSTVGVLASTADYLVWRLSVTNWSAAWLSVPLLAAEMFGAAHALGLQATIWPKAASPVRRIDDPSRFPIYLLIPTAGEPMSVLEPTIIGALAARAAYLRRYPSARVHVIVCNDGLVAGSPDWRQVESSVTRLGVTCVTRATGGGAKAGNLEHARALVGATGDALLAVLDADMVPAPDFLLATVTPFSDPAVGWVQTAQYYRNTDLPMARWAADQQSLFYEVLCPGKAARNSAFICGTNVVIRAAALDSIGGMPQDSVTEDFAASIRLAPDWRGVHLTGRFAEGLGPVDAASYLKQQNRWARGTLEVLRRHWKDLVSPRSRLSAAQRLQYGLACTHYLSGVRDLVYLLSPVIFVVSGIPAVRGADTAGFVRHFVPYFLCGQMAFWIAARGRSTWRGVVAGFISFPVLVTAALTVLTGSRSTFTITSKQRDGAVSWRPLLPHLAGLLLCLTGLGTLLARGLSARGVIAGAWIAYMAVMLAAFCSLAVWDAHRQPAARRESTGHRGGAGRRQLAAHRRRRRSRGPWGPWGSWGPWVRLPAPIRTAAGAGCALVVVVAAISLYARDSAPRPAPFRVAAPCTNELRAGLAVTAGSYTGYSRLARALEMNRISAHSAEIGDRFPRAWADEVRSAGGIPWLTLTFTHDGGGSLTSALPAVVNAVQDESLRRWARAVANWGHPLYLTVLPSVDRNYAASSAVANGGVPADSARAWAHIRRIFRANHADNVAWTWQPAAPADDADVRPPAMQIDVVAVTWIQYRNSEWVSPREDLTRVRLAHPGKPLLVTLAATGDPRTVGSWLDSAVSAARSAQAVGLVYQTDGPDPHASHRAFAAWRAGAYLTARILRQGPNHAGLDTADGTRSISRCGVNS